LSESAIPFFIKKQPYPQSGIKLLFL